MRTHFLERDSAMDGCESTGGRGRSTAEASVGVLSERSVDAGARGFAAVGGTVGADAAGKTVVGRAFPRTCAARELSATRGVFTWVQAPHDTHGKLNSSEGCYVV